MDSHTALRIIDPELDFWVDVRLRQFDGTWLVTADLAGTPDVGVSTDRDLAVLFALWSLGPDVARRLAGKLRGGAAGLVERQAGH